MLGIPIEDLLNNDSNEQALEYLPDYFEQADRLEELLNYLSIDHFKQLLNHSQSLYPLRIRTEKGLKSSQKLKNDVSVFGFSLKKSIFCRSSSFSKFLRIYNCSVLRIRRFRVCLFYIFGLLFMEF